MSRAFFAILLWLAFSSAAQAAPNDLERCIFGATGIQMDPVVCESLRRDEARESARREANRKLREESIQREKEREQEQATLQVNRAKAAEAAYAAEEARRKAAMAQQAKEVEAMERSAAAAQAKAAAGRAKATAEKKALCGDDVGKVAVGMSIARVSQCYGPVVKRGELNSPRGVVSTFHSGRTIMHVIDGKVVSWSSY